MRILLIDDDTDGRTTMALILRQAGHDVIDAPDGLTGLKLLAGPDPFDFVITDLVMPGMDGIRFLTKAKEAGLLKCPVGVLSGYYPNGENVAGAAFTMRKPAEPMELLQKLTAEANATK